MTSAIQSLIQPVRRPDEKFEAYVQRRAASHDFVASNLVGNLYWNTEMQGIFFSEARKTRPVGKRGRRVAKCEARAAGMKLRDFIASGRKPIAQ